MKCFGKLNIKSGIFVLFCTFDMNILFPLLWYLTILTPSYPVTSPPKDFSGNPELAHSAETSFIIPLTSLPSFPSLF